MPGFPGSIWANPFHIGKDGPRDVVIEKYRQYLLRSPALLALLPTLKNKVLGCWCRGLACHGDVIAEMVNALP